MAVKKPKSAEEWTPVTGVSREMWAAGKKLEAFKSVIPDFSYDEFKNIVIDPGYFAALGAMRRNEPPPPEMEVYIEEMPQRDVYEITWQHPDGRVAKKQVTREELRTLEMTKFNPFDVYGIDRPAPPVSPQRMREQALVRMLQGGQLRPDEISATDLQQMKQDLMQRYMSAPKGWVSPPDERYGRQPAKVDFADSLPPEQIIATFGEAVQRAYEKNPPASAVAMREAQKKIDEMVAVLERIKEEPLLMQTIEKMSKDKKHTYIKKGDQELRIKATEGLEPGHEVLLHPKTMQIVESLGMPPLEASRFCRDEIPDIGWDDIGGLESAKSAMIEAIELPHKYKELYRHYSKRPIKGVLLTGPPGCGKTMLAKAAANSLAKIYGKELSKTGFLYVKGPEILDQYVGQTEACIREMFAYARQHHAEKGYPAIICLDEADSILAARGKNMGGIGASIVAQFLTEMDGLEASSAIVLIMTNRPDILDPAIVRDGRCDRKVAVTRPNKKNAMAILKLNLAKVPLSAGETIDALAKEMADQVYAPKRFIRDQIPLSSAVSGAMLANCVDMAVSNAIRRDMALDATSGLTMDDVIVAVDRIQEQSHAVQHEIEMTITLRETGGE